MRSGRLRLQLPPAAGVIDRGLTNIPAGGTPLVGRDADVALALAQLVEAAGRLLTVTGVGGVGKTSLALAVARQIWGDFAHGAWVAELATSTTRDGITRAIATAIGVSEGPGSTLEQTVLGFVRDRNLLLVMDNCEQAIDGCAEVAGRLLDGAPGVRIIATSREALHLHGEVVYPLAPLDVPMAEEDARHDDPVHCLSGALCGEGDSSTPVVRAE